MVNLILTFIFHSVLAARGLEQLSKLGLVALMLDWVWAPPRENGLLNFI